MRALVVYYSRTGMTKKIADAIVSSLRCDSEEIVDTKDRSGPFGYLMAGRDAGSKKPADIQKPVKDPSGYDIVIIGTPVWAFTVSCAMRRYLEDNKSRFKDVAFFCTQGGFGSKGTFRDMESLSSKKPAAVLEVFAKEIVKGDYISKVNKFIDEISKRLSKG